jgi:hypothetical protein
MPNTSNGILCQYFTIYTHALYEMGKFGECVLTFFDATCSKDTVVVCREVTDDAVRAAAAEDCCC